MLNKFLNVVDCVMNDFGVLILDEGLKLSMLGCSSPDIFAQATNFRSSEIWLKIHYNLVWSRPYFRSSEKNFTQANPFPLKLKNYRSS